MGDQLGENFWTTESQSGANIQKAVDYLIKQDPKTEDVTEAVVSPEPALNTLSHHLMSRNSRTSQPSLQFMETPPANTLHLWARQCPITRHSRFGTITSQAPLNELLGLRGGTPVWRAPSSSRSTAGRSMNCLSCQMVKGVSSWTMTSTPHARSWSRFTKWMMIL